MTSKRTKFDYHAVRARMHEAHPAAFGPRGTAPVPLAVGVGRELGALHGGDVEVGRLRRFMSGWCGRPEYRAVLVEGAARVGLDGGTRGAVTAAHLELARAREARDAERLAAFKARGGATPRAAATGRPAT